MTRLLVRLFFGIILLPSLGSAEEVGVRGGMHSGFTRLYLDFPRIHDWEFGRTREGLEFRTGLQDAEFDLTFAFDRIDGSRIADMRQRDGGALLITLNCFCHGDVLELDGGDIVIDIKDGVAPEGWPHARWLEQVAKPDEDLQFVSPDPIIDPDLPGEPSLRPLEDIQTTARPPSEKRSIGAIPLLLPESPQSDTIFGKSGILELPEIEIEESNQSRAQDVRSDILLQLQRAAAQGLLDISPPSVDVPTITKEAASEELELLQNDEEAVRERTDHVEVETVVDRDSLNAIASALRGEGTATCPPNDWFDANAWGAGHSSFDLGHLRAELAGEFDKINASNTRLLAYRYLYFGFGAEAQQITTEFQDGIDQEEIQVIRELAAILDSERVGHSRISGLLHCNSPASFWALLANPDGAMNPDLVMEDVLKTFSDLPIHLRSLLGPEIVNALLAANHRTEALSIRSMMARSPEISEASLALVSARFTQAELGIDAATPEYTQIVADDGPEAPVLLAELIEERLAQGLPIDGQTAAAADALAVEHRGTALGARLTKAAIRAFSVSGHPDTTFQRIGDALENGSISEDEANFMRLEAFENASQSSDDVTFLRLVYTHPIPSDDALPNNLLAFAANTRNDLSERLFSLGLVDKAEQITMENEGDASSRRKLIKGQILIEQGMTEAGLEMLASTETVTADELRAKGHETLNNLAEAQKIYEEIGATEELERIAWLDEDWNALAKSNSQTLSEFATSLLGQEDSLQSVFSSVDRPPLQTSRGRIENSQKMRAMIEGLLDQSAFGIQPD